MAKTDIAQLIDKWMKQRAGEETEAADELLGDAREEIERLRRENRYLRDQLEDVQAELEERDIADEY